MPGTLFVVATPIGNLEDITLRALRVLREADVIAAEDTRRTAGLLAHHGVSTPTISFHEHNTRTRVPQLLARLEQGESVALVTDAGTPGVSDPGTSLVAACIENGIPIDPIPGPSAPLVAAVASGFRLEPLTILGFAPSRAKDRKQWLAEAAKIRHTFTFFETPHRIQATLIDTAELLANRPISVGRELTKVHQEFIRGADGLAVFGQMTSTKGEFTLVVGPRQMDEVEVIELSDQDIVSEFRQVTECGAASRREAIAAVAKKLSRSTKDVYAAIERAKTSGT